MKFKFLLLALIIVLLASPSMAKRSNPESFYKEIWCKNNKGEENVIIGNYAICDCVTNEYAVEVEFANNWMDTIGKSLHFAQETGKKPGVVLILENIQDRRFKERMLKMIEHYKLDIEVFGTGAYQ